MSNPGWVLGYVPTPTEWNNLWSARLTITPQVVAAAGTTQGTATALPDNFCIVTSGTGGVVATSSYTLVLNRTTAAISVYPISGAQFESLGTNNPVSVPTGGAVEINMTSTTQGYIR